MKNFILIGPAFPFRGGISNTNHELIQEIQKKYKNSFIITFKKLYPNFIFPGKNQFSNENKPLKINIERHSHLFKYAWKIFFFIGSGFVKCWN